MKANRNNKSAIKVENIAEYMENKRIRDRATWVVLPGGTDYYVSEGKVIPASQFESENSLILRPIRNKGNGADITKEWMFA
jgi:hypothetical protein